MRYKVPQNIDMQDKILGPLTMIQLVYAVVGFGGAYSVYSMLPKPIGIMAAIPVALFTICVCFVKINERPFLQFFESFMEFMFSTKQRTWHHQSYNDMRIIIYKPQSAKTTQEIKTKTVSHEDIAKVAQKFDSPDAKNRVQTPAPKSFDIEE